MKNRPLHESLRARNVLFLDLRNRNLDLLPIGETHAGVLANALTDLGAQITVVCWDGTAWNGVNAAVRVISLRRGGARQIRSLVGQRFDIIVDVDLSGSVAALPFARAAVARLVLIEDRPALLSRARPSRLEAALVRRLYRASTVVVSSTGLRRLVRKQLGLNGPLRAVSDPLSVSGTVKTRAERPTVVCLAPPVRRSNIDRVLRTVPLVVTEFPDVVVRILGDGAERQGLERLAYALGIQAAVRFDGRMPPARQQEVLSSAWVAVDSLDSTSAVRGAMRFGIPTITGSGSAAELVHEGGGYVFNSESDRGRALLHALRQVAQRDGEVVTLKRPATADASAMCRSQLLSIVSAEMHRAERPERRRPSDLVVVAEWHSDEASETAMLLDKRLRRTDQWWRDGHQFWALMHDCDEFDAMKVLADVDVREGDVRVAGRDDLVFARTTGQ